MREANESWTGSERPRAGVPLEGVVVAGWSPGGVTRDGRGLRL